MSGWMNTDFSLSSDSPPVQVVNALAAIALVSSDDDLLEAAISELTSISPQRVAKEDKEGTVALVLSTEALVDGNVPVAVDTLRHGLEATGESWTKVRLAKLLLASGEPEQAIALLSPPEEAEKDGAGGAVGSGGMGAEMKDKTVAGKDSAVVSSRLKSLLGIARIYAGDEAGLKELNAAVGVCPWDEEAWVALAWGRKIIAEAEAE